jgi:hypothetical protein
MTSLGAGGSLIAAALIAAALVGGLLAFRGAVDEPAEARGGDVTLPSASAVAGEPSAPEAPAAGSARTAVAERRAPPPRRRAGAQRWRSTRPVPLPPMSDPPRTETGTTGEGADGGSEEAPPPTTGDRPRTVARVVERTREAVAPVVEAAPEPVPPTVDQVVDTVADVADTVDETLAPVTALLEREL